MKKLLLIAIAALTVGSVNAQLLKKGTVSKPVAQPRMMLLKASQQKKFEVAGEKVGVKAFDKTFKVFNGSVKASDIKPVVRDFKAARAGAVQPKYEGNGTLRSKDEATSWEMLSGTATDGTTLLCNVIPNIFGFENGVIVEYTAVEGGIVIQPQLVASFPHESAPNGTFYIFLEDAASSDGSIRMTIDDEGRITGTYNIIYSLYPNETYNVAEWIQTYDGIKNAIYNLPGEITKPVASFETGNLVLFAGLGLNGYSYNNNLAITAAYTNTAFANRTTDVTTGWNWAAYEESDAEGEPDKVYASGTERDFSVPFTDNTIKNLTLTAVNQTVESDPFVFGVGKYKRDDGTDRYTSSYIYGSGYESGFTYNGETTAIMTRQDPDGDLRFYTNWATPDKASNNMSKIYLYHEKPAAPLYIEGVTLPLVGFAETDPEGNPFNLHIKIQKVTYRAGATKPVLGDVIAEGDATRENINANFDAGLTAIEFTNLYTMDENEMSTDLDYLFIDDEFVIVIEGWNNGSFSGVLGSQDAALDNVRTSTWFEMDGEPGTMYAYTSWKTSLFVGLLGATYGYLYTEDNTNITIPTDGGEATIDIKAMLRTKDNETGEYSYRLFIENVITDSETDSETGLPTWLQIGISNVNEAGTEFSLGLAADALPAGETGRQATIVFMQEGALLKVTVTQGEVSSINATKTTVKTGNAQMYNLAGQRVGKEYKGLVIKSGKKILNK